MESFCCLAKDHQARPCYRGVHFDLDETVEKKKEKDPICHCFTISMRLSEYEKSIRLPSNEKSKQSFCLGKRPLLASKEFIKVCFSTMECTLMVVI